MVKPKPTVRAALLQETDDHAVVIARVDDPSKLPQALHKDVVDMLVDLTIALLDEDKQ